MDAALDRWTTQLRKGMLEFCILRAMSGRRIYGYDLVKRLRSLNGLVISEGTVYPILSRLRRDGLVTTTLEESPEGPARKYYQLTPKGRDLLDRMGRSWRVVQDAIETLESENTP